MELPSETSRERLDRLIVGMKFSRKSSVSTLALSFSVSRAFVKEHDETDSEPVSKKSFSGRGLV